jgi:hypothetical protein
MKTKDKLHEAPGWVVPEGTDLRRRGLLGNRWGNSASGIVSEIIADYLEFRRFLDHWGRNGDVFYTEPYTTKEDARASAQKLAMMLRCHFRFTESKWNPPSTIRVEFYREG